MSALDELLTNHEKPLQDKGWLEYLLVLFWEETDGYEYAAEYASEELAKLRDDNAALRSERDALREALRWYAEARWGWTGDDESIVCEWPDWEKDPAGFHFKTGGEVASAALAGNE